MAKLKWVATLVVAVLAFCVWLSKHYNSNYPIKFAAPALGVITFFTMLSVTTDTSATKVVSDSSMRSAITAALVVMYMVLVGHGVFIIGKDAADQALSPMAQTFLTSFTSIVGVVVAFYFGTSAYIEVQSRKYNSRDNKGI